MTDDTALTYHRQCECGHEFEAPQYYRGRVIKCPRCGRKFGPAPFAEIPPQQPLAYAGPDAPVIFDSTTPFSIRLRHALARGLRGLQRGYAAGRAQRLADEANLNDTTGAAKRLADTAIYPPCPQCRGSMIADTSGRFAISLVARLLLLAAGLAVIYFIPILGWIFGPVICIGAVLFTPTNRIWRCTHCAMVAPRM